jgi:lipoyl(octanoyl) transferase
MGAAELEVRWLGRLEYAAALALQTELVEARRQGTASDTLLLLEHEPVYTIGRTRDRTSLGAAEVSGLPVVEINRGGQATYHGPGQLVGYPILDLNAYGRDLHVYLRTLEEALIRACGEAGIVAGRREGLTGVWVEDRKIASIGVGVRHWISMHGFAINVAADLTGFGAIVPCGIEDVTMTSVERESGRKWEVRAFGELTAKWLHLCLSGLT